MQIGCITYPAAGRGIPFKLKEEEDGTREVGGGGDGREEEEAEAQRVGRKSAAAWGEGAGGGARRASAGDDQESEELSGDNERARCLSGFYEGVLCKIALTSLKSGWREYFFFFQFIAQSILQNNY
jgi:hypothetical protein